MADLIAPSMMVGLALGRIGCLLNGCCYGGQTDWPWAVTFPQYSSRFETANSNGTQRYSPPYIDQAQRGEMHGFRLESGDGEPVTVKRVDPGSAADLAGLENRDSIAAIDGEPIVSLEQAKALIFNDFLAQRSVQLTTRTGKTVEIAAPLPPARSRPVHPTQVYSAIDAAILAWLLWAYYPFRRRDGEAIALLLTIHPVTRFLLEVIRTDEPELFETGMSISQNISILLLAVAGLLWWYISRQPRGTVWPLAAEAASSQRGRANRRGRPA
jgi:phosphatidylglycerol:prolipoprotein diacylglycerol transferase